MNPIKIKQNNFCFGEVVIFNIVSPASVISSFARAQIHIDIKGSVVAKLKDLDAYVIKMFSIYQDYKEIVAMYGYPIRHTPLEWGQFSGATGEIIIPGRDLSRII